MGLAAGVAPSRPSAGAPLLIAQGGASMTQAPDHQTPAATALTEFELASEPGNERIAIERPSATCACRRRAWSGSRPPSARRS